MPGKLSDCGVEINSKTPLCRSLRVVMTEWLILEGDFWHFDDFGIISLTSPSKQSNLSINCDEALMTSDSEVKLTNTFGLVTLARELVECATSSIRASTTPDHGSKSVSNLEKLRLIERRGPGR